MRSEGGDSQSQSWNYGSHRRDGEICFLACNAVQFCRYLPMSPTNLLPLSSDLKKKVVSTSETLVKFHQTT